MRHEAVVQAWFDRLNRGDLGGLLTMFTDGATIKNAASPVDSGKSAPRRLLENFFQRTTARHFQVINYAEDGDSAFASWIGLLTFAGQTDTKGAAAPLPVCLNGIDVFHFLDGRIDRLSIEHETTTVAVQRERQANLGNASDSLDLEPLVRAYFQAEEDGNVEAIEAMFDDHASIRNAAQPPAFGKEGARRFATDFRDRTEFRRFEITAIARAGSWVFASWNAHLGFRAGIAFGPIRTTEPFEIQLAGACEFGFGTQGAIHSLLIAHETTTVMKIAKESLAVR